MARVENDTSDSDENDDKLMEADEEELLDGDKDDSDDDDESITSEDEVDTNELELRVTTLESKLQENPYDFNTHADTILLLTKLGDRNRLRGAYQRTRTSFPLQASQWLAWLQLEGDGATTPEGRQEIYQLFNNAFQDCFCGGIYMEWCTMSICSDVEARDVLPKALEAAGADPLDGSLLWDTAKEYYLGQLACMSPTTSPEEYKALVEKVMWVYTNQLCRPLFRAEGLAGELREFVAVRGEWLEGGAGRLEGIEEAYHTGEGILKGLMEYEYQLENITGQDEEKINQRCAVYSKYLEYAKDLMKAIPEPNLHNLKSLVCVLYDRATSDCSAAMCRILPEMGSEVRELCEQFVDFAMANCSTAECVRCLEKAIRRCPRNSRLWQQKIRLCERMENTLEEIKLVFESALVGGFSTAEDYVTIWSTYLEALKRATDFSSEEQVDRLRKTFRLAWDSLGQMWGDTADTEFSLLQFWARLEYHHTKDYEYGRELFEEILMYPENRVKGGLWLEYIALEKLSGGVSRARTLYRRAVKNSGDPRVRWSWLSMERDMGTLDTLIDCEIICAEKAKEWEKQQQAIKESKMANSNQRHYNTNNKTNNRRQQQGTNSENADGNKQQTANKRNKGKQPMNSRGGVNDKRKSSSKPSGDSPSRRQDKRKLDDDDSMTDGSPVKIGRNGDRLAGCSVESESVHGVKRKADEDSSPMKRLKGDSVSSSSARETVMGPPPPGYKGPRTAARPDPHTQEHSEVSENDDEKNERTVFVSNLDYLVEEDTVREKLGSYGDVEELRWAKGPYGRICYCVYTDISSRDMALSRDRSPVAGRPMFMSRYNPTRETRRKHFTYSTNIERNKLFVKNIAFEACTQDKLREVFGKYGELKDIRIVTYKTGKPKGIAYVEYCDEKCATLGLQGADGLEVAGRALSVAVSAPPDKKPDALPQQPTTSRGHSRTMLFVPSAVTQKMLPKKTPQDGGQQSSETSKSNGSHPSNSSSSDDVGKSAQKTLSNSDFRNMLLNKK